MRNFTIYYFATRRLESRVAEFHRDLLQRGGDRVVNVLGANDAGGIGAADIAVMRVLPEEIGAIYSYFPPLRDKYVIGHLVWEADRLLENHEKSVGLLQEVWTASQYCRDVFRQYHDQVTLIPHVIERDTSSSVDDRSFIKNLIEYEDDCVYFLTVTTVADTRKNVKELVKAFLNSREKMKNARLVIKGSSNDPLDFVDDGQIVYLRSRLTAEQLNALYELTDVCVSAHHSEGWGLTLSDAMIFKKPVIATGYSGNLEFMNEENSFPVAYTEDYIRPEDCNNLFKSNMRWAYPHLEDLEAKLVLLYENLHERCVTQKVERASLDINRFDRNEVGALVQGRLDALRAIL